MTEHGPTGSERSYYFRVVDALEVDADLSPALRWFVATLAKHANEDGYGFWGHEKLRPCVGCSQRQLVRLFAEASGFGWVMYQRRKSGAFVPGRAPNEYWVTIPDGANRAPSHINRQSPEGANTSPSGEGANRALSAKARKYPEGASRALSVPKVPKSSPEGAKNVPEGAKLAPDLPLRSTLTDLPTKGDRARSARRTAGTEPTLFDAKAKEPEEHRREMTQSQVATPTASPSKPKRQPKPSAERSDEQKAAYTEATAAYFTAFEAARGVRPAFGARDGVAMYELLAAVGWDVKRATTTIRNALAAGAWPSDATIRVIAGDPARYSAPPRNTRGPGPVQPNSTSPKRVGPNGGLGSPAEQLARFIARQNAEQQKRSAS